VSEPLEDRLYGGVYVYLDKNQKYSVVAEKFDTEERTHYILMYSQQDMPPYKSKEFSSFDELKSEMKKISDLRKWKNCSKG